MTEEGINHEATLQEAEQPAPVAMTLTELELEHAAMVGRLAKNGGVILAQLTGDNVHTWHMATGISGEAGELLDAVKKVVCYNKPVDIENVIEELGDLEFYMEGLRSKLGITREITLIHNMKKLEKNDNARYKNGYSDAAAQARSDKVVDESGLTDKTVVPAAALGEEGRPGDANATA